MWVGSWSLYLYFLNKLCLYFLKICFQEPQVAFEDVDVTELYPCVMFYSSNPGEKVFFIFLFTLFSVYDLSSSSSILLIPVIKSK